MSIKKNYSPTGQSRTSKNLVRPILRDNHDQYFFSNGTNSIGPLKKESPNLETCKEGQRKYLIFCNKISLMKQLMEESTEIIPTSISNYLLLVFSSYASPSRQRSISGFSPVCSPRQVWLSDVLKISSKEFTTSYFFSDCFLTSCLFIVVWIGRVTPEFSTRLMLILSN